MAASTNRLSTRLDFANAWRNPPHVATRRVLGMVSGSFFVFGSVAGGIGALLLGDGVRLPAVLAIALGGTLIGVACVVFARRLPRWFYFVTILAASGVIGSVVVLGDGGPLSTIYGYLYILIVIDASFLFSFRAGLVQDVAVLASLFVSFSIAGIPAGATVIVVAVCAATTFVIAWLSRMTDAAEIDPLTGLYGRHAMMRRVTEALTAAQSRDVALVLVLFDLDGFKLVNDALGHFVGDTVLAACAQAWGEVELPHGAALCRYGGDEFILCLPGQDVVSAVATVEALRVATPEGVVFSAGVTAFRSGDTYAEIFMRADGGVYAAKARGGNTIVVAPQ